MASFDANAARHDGPIHAQLEKQGRMIGPYDLVIAAHAKALHAVLVTDNVGRKGLEMENWLA